MHTSNTFRRNLLTAALVLGAGSLWQAAAQSVAIDPAWAIGNELVRFPQGPGESLTTEPLPTSYNPGVPDAYEYQGQVAQRTQNVQYDAEGNVQFFIVDDQVFNGDGLLIADAAADPFDRDCEACFFGGEEVHVIPVPGSCTRYYVVSLFFTSTQGMAAAEHPCMLRWGVLDMALPSNLPVYDDACMARVNGRFLTWFERMVEGYSLSGVSSWSEVNVLPEHDPSDEGGYFQDGVIYLGAVEIDEAIYAASIQVDPAGRHLMVVRCNQGLVMLQVDGTGIIKLAGPSGAVRWPYNLDPVTTIVDWDFSQRGEIALHRNGYTLQVAISSYATGPYNELGGSTGHQTRINHWVFNITPGATIGVSSNIVPNNQPNANPRTYSLDLYPAADLPPLDGQGNPVTRPAVCGLEFSPNGRYIYFVKSPDHAYPNSGGPKSNFGYIDLAWQLGDPGTYHAFLPIDVPAETRKLVDTQMGINVGPNGTGNALYVIGAEADGYWLGAFLDPDNPDPANWQPRVVDLSTVAYRTEANSPLTKFKLVNRRAVSSTHAALLATQACCEDLVLARDRSAVITAEDCDLTWEPGDNAFWNTSAPVHVATELRIATGAHVIANNMEFLFGQDAELVIEAGASLVCTDCLFTTACEGTRWKGIRVEGTSTDPLQAAAHQGVLRITNSTVENAETGVWCARVNEQGYAVSGHFGGYLRAYHCTFRNCITGVHIERYQRTSPAGAVLPHRSNFFNCTFETTAQWPAGAHPYAHAHLFDVQGIKLQQCRFINHVPAQFPALNRGWGVLALMAGFDVEGSSTPDASLFQDLSIGVVAATGTLRKANVRRSWFRDNIVGAYMMACTAPEVSRSHFFVPGSSAPTLTPAGLTLHQSNTYLVEENNFHGAQMVNGSVGIHFIGDVRAEDRIYNNTFNGLNAGTYVVGRHKGNTPETEMQGLQLFCGDYTDCMLDYVLGNNTYIKEAQGFYNSTDPSQTQLAANRFYPGLVNGITISTVQPTGPTAPHFNYLRHSVPECDPLNPSDYYSDIEITAMDIFDKAEACGKGLLPHTGGGGGTGTPAYVLAAAQLNSAQAYFTGTVDTGEREDIIEAIGQDDPWLPSHTLRDYLLARCPLSDAVLLRVIARTEPMDPWHLTQVLLGNARLTPQVLRAVEHSGLLNEYMLAIVQNAGSGPTVKDLLRQEVELRAMEKARAKVLAFDAIAADSLLAAPHDSLYAMLAAHPDHTDLYLLASMAQERDQYTLATAWLDSLQAVRDDGHAMLRDLYSMDQALDGDWPQADAGQRAQLATMASAYDPGAAMAWAIRYHLGETYEVPFADLPDGSKRLTWAPDKAPRPAVRPLLEAHPNPTTGQSWVVVNMELDHGAWLRISDPQGRLVGTYQLAQGQRLHELDLSGLANGLYTCELLQGEFKLDAVKLTVQR